MPIGDIYLYDLVSCGVWPSILSRKTAVVPSPFANLVVYIIGQPQSETYVLTPVTPPGDGLNAGLTSVFVPKMAAANLVNCADPNKDKIYAVTDCDDEQSPKVNRYVLLAAAQTIGDTLRFVGECTCWEVIELASTYNEILTIAQTFADCTLCKQTVVAENCTYEERTIGYAVKVGLPQPEPPDRGFSECCYSNLVFGDLVDTNSYKNDFSSVHFQRQTPTDTVTFEIIPASTGVPVLLVDGTHGVEYPISATNTNPNLTYFKVEWRKILSVFTAGTYTIRMNVTVAGVGPTVIDSNSFVLKAFSVSKADNTVRIDSIQNGTLEKIDVNFKDSGYETSLRVQGFFGDAQAAIEQDNVIFSSKKGLKYYEEQITMKNDPEYTFQANNIPECISRQLIKEIIFGNEIFISDYNLNNHSYEYELFPVVLEDIATNDYPIRGRGANIGMTFKHRSKNNRKTNC